MDSGDIEEDRSGGADVFRDDIKTQAVDTVLLVVLVLTQKDILF